MENLSKPVILLAFYFTAIPIILRYEAPALSDHFLFQPTPFSGTGEKQQTAKPLYIT